MSTDRCGLKTFIDSLMEVLPMVIDYLTVASFVFLVIYKLLVNINVSIMCAGGVDKQA